ncbi:MAG TPA: response regulator [Candidatus Saccharimonadales bacterium]|nr:response regulator [Candidatus Saccharimonadales bacterium]
MSKILLVEDDNSLRGLYKTRLEAEGYIVAIAQDGEEALSIVTKENPDIIILDVMMPKISGFDTLEILRSRPETKGIKVIMMTALSQAQDKARATDLGANRYLVKSQVALEKFIETIKEVLDEPPIVVASPVEPPTPTPPTPTPDSNTPPPATI